MKRSLTGKHVIITGGTSGLGRSLGMQFIEKGSKVVALGKNTEKIAGTGLEAIFCDLAKLNSVVDLVEQLRQKNAKFDILINNAGILSPPTYTETSDGFEMSYQVNFLSHVLLTRLLLKNGLLKNGMVINMSSPIYTRGKISQEENSQNNTYSILQAYADSKLFMALFSEKIDSEGVRGFSFNPGTFSSGIYRSQKAWFKGLYKIAAPFMPSSERVASRLIKILAKDQFSNGRFISKNGSEKRMIKVNAREQQSFWEKIEMQLDSYLYF
jgi:NAD(P)-dependent dehydrogenase (short-subunit alcohol dehydrogenase family)